MSINKYIERELIRKSLGTYFRRGKWLLHLAFLLIFWFSLSIKQIGPLKDWTFVKVLLTGGLLFPFIAFFYTYCLYLIPYCFKQNRYRRFWFILFLMLAVCPLIDFGIQLWARPHLPAMDANMDEHNVLYSIGKGYFNFITSFVGFTALLYFMELLEGINTDKETAYSQSEITATELHRIKTRMNPAFMIRSLDGIIKLAENRDNNAPASVIDFSDVLRYRLYRSKQRLVTLQEELTQLSNLMQLHNVLPGQENTCTLETEGDIEKATIVPLSLINIAEPLLATFRPEDNWSMLMYLLIEEKEIQVAIELTSDHNDDIPAEAQIIHEDLQRLLYSGLNFTLEKEQNTFSLRTCIPIFRNLTVSS